MNEVFREEFAITSNDFTVAGEASAKIKNILKKIGLAPAQIRRVTIAAYEAEMNMIIHSDGGSMTMLLSKERVKLHFHDNGPGINSIDDAMQEGFSTASANVRTLGFGAGMGLPNIKRNCDTFSISSDKTGTNLDLVFNIK